MDPFKLFESSGIYKAVILYFSKCQGLAVVAREIAEEQVEVMQIAGEVDPHSGEFLALDYVSLLKDRASPTMTREDFDWLVSVIASRVDAETRMSVIEPDVMKSITEHQCFLDSGPYLH
jgi:hypothetical protein